MQPKQTPRTASAPGMATPTSSSSVPRLVHSSPIGFHGHGEHVGARFVCPLHELDQQEESAVLKVELTR